MMHVSGGFSRAVRLWNGPPWVLTHLQVMQPVRSFLDPFRPLGRAAAELSVVGASEADATRADAGSMVQECNGKRAKSGHATNRDPLGKAGDQV